MKIRMFLFIFVFLCFPLKSFGGILNEYYKDVSYTFQEVKKNKKALTIFGSALGLSFLLDEKVRELVAKNQSKFLTDFTDFTNNFGEYKLLFPSIAFLGTTGYLTKNKKLAEASLTSLEAGFTAGLITVGIKVAIGRQRPYCSNDPFTFKPFDGTFDCMSFPSGHTTLAWSMITPFAVYYDKPILYLIPISVNIARIYKNKHWLSDTVMSAGLGFSIGYFFSKRHLTKKQKVVFNITPNSIMVGFRF
ncbi:MAG: phosphatase PAP2 family protein [Desulfurobacteriaceae bacterium]